MSELGTTGGFYLGVVDLSTCVTLTRILILYHVCPEETSELISRPEAIESQSLEGSPSVEGECVENSSTESGANPILIIMWFKRTVFCVTFNHHYNILNQVL